MKAKLMTLTITLTIVSAYLAPVAAAGYRGW